MVKKISIVENIDNSPATPESVWALLRENARQMEMSRIEFDERMRATDERMKVF